MPLPSQMALHESKTPHSINKKSIDLILSSINDQSDLLNKVRLPKITPTLDINKP